MFAKYNCELGGSICERFHIESFPTVVLIRKGQFVETFQDELEAPNIVEFMEKTFNWVSTSC
jgi:thioredoxin-like negative regulator of GroEL